MWNDLKNKTLYAEVASTSERINVANSLIKDLVKIQSWCSTWRMKLYPRKTHCITISQSRTPYPPLILCGFDVQVSSSFKLLGGTGDNKLICQANLYYSSYS